MKVKCKDADFSNKWLTVDQVYEVTGEVYGEWTLDGVASTWSKSRFIIIETIKVQCKDDAYSGSLLKLGQVYQVVKERETGKWVLNGISGSWSKSRFTILEDTRNVADTPTPTAAKKRAPNEPCPCGVGLTRSQCEYHRD